jgi:malate synthase
MWDDVTVTARDLLKLPQGTITEAGLRTNIRVGIQYMAHWLSGNGCVPLYHLMEDAATAEISRAQVWQWVHHPEGKLDDGRNITMEFVSPIIVEEMGRIEKEVGSEQFHHLPHQLAGRLFEEIIANPEFEEFLTLKAYEHLE